VGGRIKQADPKHLIASGLAGGTQCGVKGADYSIVHASSAVDVATFHDYNQDTSSVPVLLRTRLAQASALGKPLVSEEVGIKASSTSSATCVTPAARATLLAHKLSGQLQAGSRGFLPWFYAPATAIGCRHDLAPGDPALTYLQHAPL
jgi:hypothetical protein